MTCSYTTSFHCFDGSYALIEGADLTLEYDFGHSNNDVRITLSTNIVQLTLFISHLMGHF